MTIKDDIDKNYNEGADILDASAAPVNNSSNTVTEKIKFTKNKQIIRSYPVLLADNGKISLPMWDNFCDTIDKCTKPLGRVKFVKITMWILVFIAIAVNAAVGWQLQLYNYYAIFVPVLAILCFLACKYEGWEYNNVASSISNACASASNHDRDLTLTLKGCHPDAWFIEVALRNVLDIEEADIVAAYVPETDYTNGGDAPLVAAQAVPVAVASSLPTPGATPKKYVKDSEGKLMLNPAYTDWKNSQ